MSKNEKKPTKLSMGGVVPRKSQDKKALPDIQPLKQQKAATKIFLPEKKNKPSSKNFLKNHVAKPKLKSAPSLTELKNKFFFFVVPVFIAGLYFFDINKFPPIQPEEAGQNGFNSSSDIDSSAYLPAKVALVGLSKLGVHHNLNTRILSVIVMLFILGCFYGLLRLWISRRMSVLALLLFSSSSWALFQVRQANVTAMMFGLIPVFLYIGKIILDTESKLLKVVLAFILAQFFFVPGAIWFFLFLVFGLLIYKNEYFSLRTIILPLSVIIAVLAAYVGLMFHLGLANSSQFLRLAGVELGSLPSVSSVTANVRDLPNQMFLNGINDSSAWLRGTPIIDSASVVLLLLGLICLFKTKIYPLRKTILSVFLVLSILLIFINGITYVSVILPLVYLLIALGITYLLDQWMTIFPNNPIARSAGLVFICLLVAMICAYHMERYFVGWPRTSEYHQLYRY